MKILFVGAGGSGMAAMVRWHLRLQDEVFVIDDMAPAEALMVQYPGAKAWDSAVKPEIERIVFSDAIPAGHAIRTYAAEQNIPIKSFSEELGALCENHRVIAIAGTHGKSTTTALLSWAFASANHDPLCVIGAEVNSETWTGGFRYGDGPVVVEADEYKKHFFALRPETIVITSLEMDHFDTYTDEKDLLKTFFDFCSQDSVKKVLIARGQPMLEDLSRELIAKGIAVMRFGDDGDFIFAKNIQYKNGDALISLSKEEDLETIKLSAPTCPHISNLLGVVAILVSEKISWEEIKKGIASFPGIRRRLEKIGLLGQAEIYSDYAHHPTAVAETLGVCKKIWPSSRIGVLFEPHERLRTSRLCGEYENAFASADIVGLLPVYDPIGRERKDIQDDACRITAKNISQIESYDAGFAWMQKFANDFSGEQAIIIIMGAGPIDGQIRKRLKAVKL